MADQKIRSLQILRFVAAAMVVWTHAIAFAYKLPDASMPHAGLGASGVDIFFVLSGVVIGISIKGRPTARAFLVKRLLRIAPLYYLITLAWLPVCGFFGWPLNRPANIATALLFWPAWGDLEFPVDPIGWSLCFEMLFYFATALTLLSRRWLFAIGPAYIGMLIAAQYVHTPALAFLGNAICLDFLLGLSIARWWNFFARRPLWMAYALFAAGASIIYLSCPAPGLEDAWFVVNGFMSLYRAIFWGGGAALIVLAFLSAESYFSAWARPFIFLGNASYAIYITHWPLLAIIGWMIRDAPSQPFMVPMLFAIGIAAGVMVYRYVEMPLKDMIQKRLVPPVTSYRELAQAEH